MTSTTGDPNPADNAAEAATVVRTMADLAVTKTGPGEALAGSSITYTVVVTNYGPSDATQVTADRHPAGDAHGHQRQPGLHRRRRSP